MFQQSWCGASYGTIFTLTSQLVKTRTIRKGVGQLLGWKTGKRGVENIRKEAE